MLNKNNVFLKIQQKNLIQEWVNHNRQLKLHGTLNILGQKSHIITLKLSARIIAGKKDSRPLPPAPF